MCSALRRSELDVFGSGKQYRIQRPTVNPLCCGPPPQHRRANLCRAAFDLIGYPKQMGESEAGRDQTRREPLASGSHVTRSITQAVNIKGTKKINWTPPFLVDIAELGYESILIR